MLVIAVTPAVPRPGSAVPLFSLAIPVFRLFGLDLLCLGNAIRREATLHLNKRPNLGVALISRCFPLLEGYAPPFYTQ